MSLRALKGRSKLLNDKMASSNGCSQGQIEELWLVVGALHAIRGNRK